MAGRADDELDFFNADMGPTTLVNLSTTAAQTTDADGALPPGRYLLQVIGLATNAVAFVKQVPFKKTETVALIAAPPAFPFAATTAIEVNVRKDFSDRIVGRCDTGTAKLYITQLSRAPATTKKA